MGSSDAGDEPTKGIVTMWTMLGLVRQVHRWVRPGPHPVPGTYAEARTFRGFWWGSLVLNAGFAVLFTIAIFVDDGESQSTPQVFAGVALAWWAMTIWLAVVILYRPRHTPESLERAGLKRASHGPAMSHQAAPTAGIPTHLGAIVPGSARVSIAIAGAALAWMIAFSVFAIVAETGWRVFWIVFALLLVPVAVDKALNARPRWLLLTPQRIFVSGSRTTSSLAWSDIRDIEFVQGHDGLMVFRLQPYQRATPSLTHRHPFSRKKRTYIDVEAVTFDLDPYLLYFALWAYIDFPYLRDELGTPTAPSRLTDPAAPFADAGLRTELANYRPERPKH